MSTPLYPPQASTQVAEARHSWAAGRRLEAGRLLYEAVLPADRPRWAGRLLGLVCHRLAAPACVERVLEIAFDPTRWPEGHEAFGDVRRQLLQEERRGNARDERLYRLLALTEWVAKVTYNASGYPAPFDHHAGWRVLGSFYACLECLGDAEGEDAAQRLLFGLAPE